MRSPRMNQSICSVLRACVCSLEDHGVECAHIFMSSCRYYKQGLRFITTRRNKQVLISQGCIARMRKIHGHYNIYYIITDILCDIACFI